MMGRFKWGSRRHAILGVFSLALMVRIALVVGTGSYRDLDRSELEHVALAVAHGDGFANPYLFPTGPTAHVAPVYTGFLAVIFMVFGEGLLGEIVKQVLSCTVTSLQYALLPIAALCFGLSFREGVLAGLIGAVLPLKMHTELSGDWEAPYAALAFIGVCLIVLRRWGTRDFSASSACLQGACWGGLILLAPVFVPVLCSLLLLGCFHFRAERKAFARHAVIALLIAGATVAPWVMRNWTQFHAFIPVRDNFGLEFYLSNHPGAHLLITDNFRGPAASALHPTFSPTQAAEVRRIGEVAYNAIQLKEGIAAVRNDPKRFLEMTLARTLWFWFPWSDSPPRDVVSHALGLATLVGLGLYLRRRTLQAKFVAAVIVSFPLVYYVLQCSTRYRYPIDWLLLLASAHAAWSAYDWFRAAKPLHG